MLFCSLCCLSCLLYTIMYGFHVIGCILCIHIFLPCSCMCLYLFVLVFKHCYTFRAGSYLSLHTGSWVPFLEPCLLACGSFVIQSSESTNTTSKPTFVPWGHVFSLFTCLFTCLLAPSHAFSTCLFVSMFPFFCLSACLPAFCFLSLFLCLFAGFYSCLLHVRTEHMRNFEDASKRV